MSLHLSSFTLARKKRFLFISVICAISVISGKVVACSGGAYQRPLLE